MQKLNSKALRALLLVGTAATLSFTAPSVMADDAITLSANAALVSDYRFRGVSLSNEDIAIQGGFDASIEGGFYVGAWGSSIENFAGAETELDIYAGYATSFSGLDFDIGMLAYTYPGSSDTTYWEAYTSIGGSAGTLGWTLGATYAFDQSNLGDQDNIYVYGDLSYPIADTPLSINGHIGLEDGAFGDPDGGSKIDWTLGASYDFKQFSLGVSYVDTNIDADGSDAGVIISLGASF